MRETFKIWKLKGEIHPDDELFCRRQGIRCQVHTTFQDFEIRGQKYSMPVFNGVELETKSNVQETILRLRFGDRVYVSQIGLPSTWE